ncbi:MAG: DUF1624 domain-containing protein [Fluviicola sp.]|jgi:uncharacterized membrane protein|nr:DUF1624 domain-containing protein [Fluviicola sp.]
MSENTIETSAAKAPKERLKFIDMARSIAILLMLEGHFIGCTLANQDYYHNSQSPIYFAWNFVRGFTAPMFFTVTGLVFVYLLSMNKEAGFLKNKRVSRGFRRSFELIFWGYALQLSLIHIWGYFHGEFSDWMVAFHVLHSIGFGISFLLLIYGLFRWIKKGNLALYYFIAGTTLFGFYPFFKHRENITVLIEKIDTFSKKESNTITRTEYDDVKYLLYQLNKKELETFKLEKVKGFFEKTKHSNLHQLATLHSFNKKNLEVEVKEATGHNTFYPLHAPMFIQNMFYGPHSVFPIIPWLAFTFYGGMVGALLHRYQEHVKKTWFPLTFIGMGLILNLFGWTAFRTIDSISKAIHFHDDLDFVSNAWLYGRVGQVLIVLGILMFIEKYFHIKESLFLKVGQNTLPIYVIHCVVLYGGIFGVGLKNLYADQLTPYQAIPGAIVFIATFVLMIKYWELITGAWDNLKMKIVGLFTK